jgi:hypothetical protein
MECIVCGVKSIEKTLRPIYKVLPSDHIPLVYDGLYVTTPGPDYLCESSDADHMDALRGKRDFKK